MPRRVVTASLAHGICVLPTTHCLCLWLCFTLCVLSFLVFRFVCFHFSASVSSQVWDWVLVGEHTFLGLAAFDLGELLGMQTRASAREEPLVVPLRGSSKGGAVPVLAWCATTKADSLDTDTSLAVVMNVCCLTRHSLASHHSGARAAHRFH